MHVCRVRKTYQKTFNMSVSGSLDGMYIVYDFNTYILINTPFCTLCEYIVNTAPLSFIRTNMPVHTNSLSLSPPPSHRARLISQLSVRSCVPCLPITVQSTVNQQPPRSHPGVNSPFALQPRTPLLTPMGQGHPIHSIHHSNNNTLVSVAYTVFQDFAQEGANAYCQISRGGQFAYKSKGGGNHILNIGKANSQGWINSKGGGVKAPPDLP